MASCSVDGKGKVIPTSLLIEGISEWKSHLDKGVSIQQATALSYVSKLKDKVDFSEWVDFLKERALLNDEQVKIARAKEDIQINNLKEAGSAIGVEYDSSDTVKNNRDRIKSKNKEVNTAPEQYQKLSKRFSDALSVASKGRSDTDNLTEIRAKQLGAQGETLSGTGWADISLLISSLLPKKGFKEGIALHKEIEEALPGKWDEAYMTAAGTGISVNKGIKVVEKKYKRKIKSLISNKTDVELAGEQGKFYTEDQAIAVYLYDLTGHGAELGVLPSTISKLSNYVKSNQFLNEIASSIYDTTNGWVKPNKDWDTHTLQSRIRFYITKDLVKELLDEYGFNAARDAIFSPENKLKIKATYKNGDQVVANITSVLNGMSNINTYEGSGRQEIAKAISAITALPIGGNVFTGVKQLTSFPNFIDATGDVNNALKYFQTMLFSGETLDTWKKVWNSDYVQNRFGGASIDPDFALLVEGGKITPGSTRSFLWDVHSQLVSLAYTPVSIGDIGAIMIGGVPTVINYKNHYKTQINPSTGNTHTEEEAFDKAMLKMKKGAEKTQQSKLQSKTSADQRKLLGKLTLVFKTVQAQAAREVKQEYIKLQRLGKEADPKEIRKSVAKMAYYSTITPLIFNFVSTALLALAFGDDEDFDEKVVASSIYSVIEFNLLGRGIRGAVLNTGFKIMREVAKQMDEGKIKTDRVTREVLGLVPGISIYTDRIGSLGWAIKKNDPIESALLATELGTLLPVGNATRHLMKLQLLFNDQVSIGQKVGLSLGIKPHNLFIDKKLTK